MKIHGARFFLIVCTCLGLIGQIQAQVLSPAEAADLKFMGEEEKLARDVYQHLFDLWALPIFNNIANAEQQHLNAGLNLLTTYGLTHPTARNSASVFTNAALQQLYDDLVVQGAASTLSALEVGILIEEAEIKA
jgi:hypothetical protein